MRRSSSELSETPKCAFREYRSRAFGRVPQLLPHKFPNSRARRRSELYIQPARPRCKSRCRSRQPCRDKRSSIPPSGLVPASRRAQRRDRESSWTRSSRTTLILRPSSSFTVSTVSLGNMSGILTTYLPICNEDARARVLRRISPSALGAQDGRSDGRALSMQTRTPRALRATVAESTPDPCPRHVEVLK